MSTITKVLEVLRQVRSHDRPWPSEGSWRVLLPAWFVDACAPEPTEGEQQDWNRQWKSMTYEERREYARAAPWTLTGWLAWFRPEGSDLDRGWAWVGASEMGGDGIVTVEIDGWPYPHGTLDWLLRTAGATEIEPT